MTRRTQHRLVSTTTWSFFVLYAALTSVGSRGVTAQNNTTSSSSSSYPECSGYVPHIGDSVCDDELNNNADCGYDGGDCCSCTCVDSLTKSCGYDADFNCTDPNVPDDCGETPSPAAAFGFPNCTGYMWYLGNEICNDDLNNEECGYDGGDCCRCTCRSTGYDNCGYHGYDCLDPDAPTDCESASPTPSPAAGLGYPDCTGYMSNLQNGYCNSDLNNEECGYDGGDCCSCTCEDGTSTCGTHAYDCLDPDAPTDCESASPTPSPAAALGYPNCTGNMISFQTGYCTPTLNNEECGYDGGDCCSCTCEDGTSTCGTNGYDCLDPDANCPTSSSTPSPAAGLGYPDCTGDMSDLQNGYCDSDLNNEECGYDGGDCCSCTCEDGTYNCGTSDYDCLNPDADCSTPSPAAGLGYPDCTGDMSGLQNGYCDSDLNNEDCGYDGGDCCECSCAGNNGDYECGENSYTCLDPDPCPSAEKSSENAILVGAIIFIAWLCAVCAGGFVVRCIIMKRRARAATSGATAHSAPLSPPPAYWTTSRRLQWEPNRTTNNPAGQKPAIAQPAGLAGPSHQVYVVNPQSAVTQSRQRPRAVMSWGRRAPPGHSYTVTGPRAYPQPSAPPAPPQPDSTDSITHRVTSARVPTFRSAPLLEGSVLEGSINTVTAGHHPNAPNADAIEVERIRLAVAESRRVQTISEAIFRRETCLPQSDAFTALVTGTGNSPSDITNGGIVEEEDPSNAGKKDNVQEASSGSEWGSDEEGGTEEKRPQGDDEFSAGVKKLTGTGEVGGDKDEQEEKIGPKGPAQEEGEEDDDNTSHVGEQAASSNNEGKEEMVSDDIHQAEISAVSAVNLATENGDIPDSLKDDVVDSDPGLSAKEKFPKEVEEAEDVIGASMAKIDASDKEENIEGAQVEQGDESKSVVDE